MKLITYIAVVLLLGYPSKCGDISLTYNSKYLKSRYM